MGQEQKNSFEKKLQCAKESLLKSFYLVQLYWQLAVDIINQLWIYDEFRLGVYVFSILSFIPIFLFLLFASLMILLGTVLASFIWTLFVFTGLTIGLVLVVPVLCGFAIISSLVIISNYAYHVLVKKKIITKMT
ncbi:uncharacterized protein BX663DRAFT_546616 [Cokeromyces recurvatus]|uniref:uncharacterized protein n=1 Tax=Cokeromyces recurvatus TaxID=90255 RepID=UPI00221F8E15|nr:uncharacterized protein BX663DRAFT_546616 [Cokeromyces recurvatus]KAI7898272.1 hypothetical protein BX663DRAFT_546616 [Cokeromyces recurvatus]